MVLTTYSTLEYEYRIAQKSLHVVCPYCKKVRPRLTSPPLHPLMMRARSGESNFLAESSCTFSSWCKLACWWWGGYRIPSPLLGKLAEIFACLADWRIECYSLLTSELEKRFVRLWCWRIDVFPLLLDKLDKACLWCCTSRDAPTSAHLHVCVASHPVASKFSRPLHPRWCSRLAEFQIGPEARFPQPLVLWAERKEERRSSEDSNQPEARERRLGGGESYDHHVG